MFLCFTISAAIFDNGSISSRTENSVNGSSTCKARVKGSNIDDGVETGVVRPVLGCEPNIRRGILSVTVIFLRGWSLTGTRLHSEFVDILLGSMYVFLSK